MKQMMKQTMVQTMAQTTHKQEQISGMRNKTNKGEIVKLTLADLPLNILTVISSLTSYSSIIPSQ